MDEVCLLAATERPDVVVFCESWLNESIADDLIHVPGYQRPFRCDRKLRRGGGVCLFVKDHFPVRYLTGLPPPPPCIESVWLFLSTLKLIILALYVPPGLSASQHYEISDYIVCGADEAFNNVADSNLIILGDINNLPTSGLENSLSLRQVVQIPTRGASILDKILIDENICDFYCSPTTRPNFGRADHLAVMLQPVNRPSDPARLVKVFDFRASNIRKFQNSLKLQRWHDLYKSTNDVNGKCNSFYRMLSNALRAIPFTFVELSTVQMISRGSLQP